MRAAGLFVWEASWFFSKKLLPVATELPIARVSGAWLTAPRRCYHGKETMKHTAFITAILATAGLAVAGTAMAGPGGFGKHGPRMSFEQLDTDGNGEISKAELQNQRAAHFKQADANGDGQLSLEEMQVAGRQQADDRAAEMLKKLDANGDGALSQDELPKPRRTGKMFDRIDADGSGGISAEEFAEMREKMEHRGKRKGFWKSSDEN